MKSINRRKFLSYSALGLSAAAFIPQLGFPLSANAYSPAVELPVGFQVWYIRKMLNSDFPGTLKMMAGLGYQTLEMCSPPGYEDSGFGPLMKYSAKEMKQIINDAGLTCESSHYGMDELKNHLEDRIKFAQDSGQKQMILSSFGLSEYAGLDDWMKAADELNKIGEKVTKAGLHMGYHNHDMEFISLEGTLIYDALMKQFNPDIIKMQFQVAVIRMGYKAADYFRKYPGRFISAHLADWSSSKNNQVPIGQGDVDWKEFFAATKTAGLKNIYVEMDLDICRDAPGYLHKL